MSVVIYPLIWKPVFLDISKAVCVMDKYEYYVKLTIWMGRFLVQSNVVHLNNNTTILVLIPIQFYSDTAKFFMSTCG